MNKYDDLNRGEWRMVLKSEPHESFLGGDYALLIAYAFLVVAAIVAIFGIINVVYADEYVYEPPTIYAWPGSFWCQYAGFSCGQPDPITPVPIFTFTPTPMLPGQVPGPCAVCDPYFPDNTWRMSLLPGPPANPVVANPEPATWLLLVSGLGALAWWRRR